ncbi:cell envelope biogenesis protein OmpA [Ulvibacterium sp.]|uniref:cell envelope biogenesis protein OmpA n=1 Tax=Ulvibacterium sp. TaxID=2665914 RepID=UPI002608ED1F|nr:cell envelope biogenesis protein OmpA [Ulvibacterium sp.]
MKNTTTHNLIFGCLALFLSCALSAQRNSATDPNVLDLYSTYQQLDSYLEMKRMGYDDQAIFEDLGNANFLAENYEKAVFWYTKLKDISKSGTLETSYQKRYHHALKKTTGTASANQSDNRDWVADVRADYQLEDKSTSKYWDFEFGPNGELITSAEKPIDQNLTALLDNETDNPNGYKAPVALTANGTVAYFSKSVLIKPEYGIFSKKEKIQKIYRAEKINGQWKNVTELALCPKRYSATHPTISEDGKRLFFASNMPGTFGKFDIYVAAIQGDGTFGVAKNLGEKVNSKKNDLYPNLAAGNTLFFASDGRNGYGGLDLHMAQVGRKKVDWSVNLGSDINSKEDDFSIVLPTRDRQGYVVSNRGMDQDHIQRIAFTYDRKKYRSHLKSEHDILEALYSENNIDYSSTLFEDEQ